MINHIPGKAMVGAVLSIVCAATVFGSASAVAASPRFALPACYGSDTPPTERPDQVGFQTCADGSKELTDLKWTS